MSIKSALNCVFSPRLLKVYGNGPLEQVYEPNVLEHFSDKIITSLSLISKLGAYTSPLLIGFCYRNGYSIHSDGFGTFVKLMTSLGAILVVSLCLRGLGRAQNATYNAFVRVLNAARAELTPANKRALSMYDFEFYAWPIEYDCDKVARETKTERTSRRNLSWLSLPCDVVAYLAIHTFGVRMIYPGSVGLLQVLFGPSLLQGRAKLVETNKAVRYKLLSRDKNEIDAMFVDRRTSTTTSSHKGQTLMVCCEGNAGFYEIGIAGTAVEAGYSVLGWNHPGFAGSTGKPYPSQERNAIDAVMQFAIDALGFVQEDIMLFAWSIGGYAASWAAMNYPNVKGVVLDATFDDLLPLAVNQMPKSWSPLVRAAIRNHIDLHNSEQLIKYPGPVLLIRRTEDEVICLRDGDLSSNRGNDLLVELLRFRYPTVMDDERVEVVRCHLATTNQGATATTAGDDLVRYDRAVESYAIDNGKEYPMVKLGEGMSSDYKSQLALFLAGKYMKDYKASHCTALPPNMLREPWDVNVDNNGFVLT